MTFSSMAGLKKRIFSEHRPKLTKKSIFFAKKVPNIGISPGFWNIKKGNGVSNIVLKVLAPYHADMFQNGDLKYFEVATTPPPLPSNFDGSPYPHLSGVSPGFLHQNDRKGCKRDVLDARGHFLLRFCAAGDKP